MTVYLRPHLPLNIAFKSRLENKIGYLETVTKGQVDSQPEDTVVIFDCSQEVALKKLSTVKNPNLGMGFEINFELRVEERSLKMVGSTEHFGEGGVILGQFDKTPVLPPLPDDFLQFRGHYTLREVYFRDDRQASNPKHFFFLTSGEDGTSPELDLIGEQVLAAYQAKKTETQVASINEKFNALLLENVKTNKRPREDYSQD